jgi:aminoglycoside 6'-N-acetyltransferase I
MASIADSVFTIRTLGESDLGEWLRLRLLLWDESSEDDQKDEMLDIIEHPDSQLVVVADIGAGRLVGFLEASIRSFAEDCDTENVGYLEGWYVQDGFRQIGIGGRLVKFAENWAKQKGCVEMASDAEIGNPVSLEAHLKLGYSETSRLVHLRKEL